ncbi:hypothetical protein [Nocardiopsis chromatogenes]|uniref:hypothetical protein n=1 Tax=Nocardiopsis chromatogenes TaxID=280239 RepID=UPI000345A4D9|nr:hypothetical protein [Nocardiopsis chromatogenes]
MPGLALPPYLLSRAIDDGLAAGDGGRSLLWVSALSGAGLLTAALATLRHRTMSKIRMDASLRTVRTAVHHSMLLGTTLPGGPPPGRCPRSACPTCRSSRRP